MVQLHVLVTGWFHFWWLVSFMSLPLSLQGKSTQNSDGPIHLKAKLKVRHFSHIMRYASFLLYVMQARQIFSESRCDFRNLWIKTSFLLLIYVITTNKLKKFCSYWCSYCMCLVKPQDICTPWGYSSKMNPSSMSKPEAGTRREFESPMD
jgi:hypothetical protein